MGSLRFGLILSALVLATSCSREGRVPAVGTIERHRFEIAAPASEQIVALPVREGQGVRTGEVVAQLDREAAAATRAGLAAQVNQLQRP